MQIVRLRVLRRGLITQNFLKRKRRHKFLTPSSTEKRIDTATLFQYYVLKLIFVIILFLSNSNYTHKFINCIE